MTPQDPKSNRAHLVFTVPRMSIRTSSAHAVNGVSSVMAIFYESRLRKSAQGDKWSFCLTAGKIGPRIRREHKQETAPEPCIGL